MRRWRDGYRWSEHVCILEQLILDEISIDALENKQKLPYDIFLVHCALRSIDSLRAKIIKLTLSISQPLLAFLL